MAAAQTKPFAFDDVFTLGDDAASATEKSFTACDIETARREGYEAGADDAKAREEAAQTALLQSIAAAFGARRRAYEAAVDAHRNALSVAAATVLKRFCAKLAEAREIGLAEDLLDRLTKDDGEAAPATLNLNPDSLAKHRDALIEILKTRGFDRFVALEGDETLRPGEARIDWRGGAMARRLDDAMREIDTIFHSLAPTPNSADTTTDPDTENPA